MPNNKEVEMRGMGRWIIGFTMLIGALLVMEVVPAWAACEGRATGKVRTDQTVYLQSAKMTVVHEITNDTDDCIISFALDGSPRTFSYDIIRITGPGAPVHVRSGTLTDTGTPFVLPGGTDSFAAGTISLKDLPPALYRIFVNAPKLLAASTVEVNASAGTVFRIAPSSEAGTITP